MDPDERWKMSDRAVLLDVAKWFVERAQGLKEVQQIALFGSICTPKHNPKDVDLLVTLTPGSDLRPLATLARKLQGRIQKGNLGSDVFVVEDGKYIGRACHYRDPWARVVCRQRCLVCATQRPFLCDTSGNFTVRQEFIDEPALILWPEVKMNADLPPDVRACFGL